MSIQQNLQTGQPGNSGLPSSDTDLHHEPVSLKSGYGTVVEREKKLIADNRYEFDSSQTQELSRITRILAHHDALLLTTLNLILSRMETLPCPARFESWQSHREVDERQTPHPDRTEQRVIADLIGKHTAMIRDLQALVAKPAGAEQVERLLSEAIAHHDDMAWMLNSILREQETSGNPHSLMPDVAASEQTAVARWDGEGGSGDPQVRTG
ncbi:MAG: hypothetical protein SFV32_03545 [Opitutaceae bacterium]|nr:hypothetical protein [Opitutaceae bacterium]